MIVFHFEVCYFSVFIRTQVHSLKFQIEDFLLDTAPLTQAFTCSLLVNLVRNNSVENNRPWMGCVDVQGDLHCLVLHMNSNKNVHIQEVPQARIIAHH